MAIPSRSCRYVDSILEGAEEMIKGWYDDGNESDNSDNNSRINEEGLFTFYASLDGTCLVSIGEHADATSLLLIFFFTDVVLSTMAY